MCVRAVTEHRHERASRVNPGSPQVINQVGAASLRATLNCEEFATAHSSTSHFDINSFVGLAVFSVVHSRAFVRAPAPHFAYLCLHSGVPLANPSAAVRD